MSNRILAAEDSPTQAAVLHKHLADAGFAVTLVGNGAEAQERLAAEPFDLVLSDVVMPDVDGYELCRAVKERYPKLPVVLLTSMNDPMDVVNALSAGADNFLRKPYEPVELVQRVRNMLHNKQLRDEGRTQTGLELFFLGRRFMINSDREQILDLLVSTFEDLVSVNHRLLLREDELARAHEDVMRRLAESELERDRLDAVLAAIPAAVAVFDPDGTIVNANERLSDLTGHPLSALRGAVVWDAVSFVDSTGAAVPRPLRALTATLRDGRGAALGTSFDLFLQRSDGDPIPVVARSEPIRDRDGLVVGGVGTLEDLRELIKHDPVTALPGRRILVEALRTTVRSSAQHGTLTSVVAISIDRYARIRRSLPGAGADHVVATVASRLRPLLDSHAVQNRTSSALPAYLGDGELVIILPEVESEADSVVVAELLTAGLAGSVEVDGMEVAVTVSAAVATCTPDDDPASLVASVAAGARRASDEGGGRVAASDTVLHAQVVDYLNREHQLRVALETRQLVTHYQPQVDIRDGRPVAVEALVRWQHPERGLLGAGEVIPLAVESGLIAAVSWQVLEDACRQAADWRRTLPGGADLGMSVNLAAEQLAEPGVAGRIATVLRASGLEPTALVLEITEGSVMEEADAAREQLDAIKALGVQVAIDDFGTGYSSLLQLRRLPVDVLKIDHSFIEGMLDNPADGAIVAGTVRLARALGLGIVAEGVETAEQLVQLRILGCDRGQGYHWAKPMAADDLSSWWSAQTHVPLFEPTAAPGMVDADDRQDEAISYLAHELRAPLAAVTGYAGLLEQSSSRSPEFVAAILRNAREIESRIRALTESTDVLRGGLTIRSETQDVAELLRTLTSDIAPQLLPHPVEFASNGPAVALVDPGRLTQAISNLLTNAAKFAPGDTPIEVAVTADEVLVTVTVRDHGPGVPDARRQELFRRFSRLGSTTKGMGIGLYLARSVVAAHGGALRYDHAPGGGALFTVQLPTRHSC